MKPVMSGAQESDTHVSRSSVAVSRAMIGWARDGVSAGAALQRSVAHMQRYPLPLRSVLQTECSMMLRGSRVEHVRYSINSSDKRKAVRRDRIDAVLCLLGKD